MRERGEIEKLRELQRSERVKINELAEAQGLRRFSHEYSTVWVLKDQEEVGAIPSKFFVQKYDKEGEVVLDKRTLDFPIQDPTQLVKSLEALNALYEGCEGAVVYDSNNPAAFIQFVGSLVEPKQPQPKK